MTILINHNIPFLLLLLPNPPTLGDIRIDYLYGRVDKQECPFGESKLPDPQKGLSMIERVFVKQMGKQQKQKKKKKDEEEEEEEKEEEEEEGGEEEEEEEIVGIRDHGSIQNLLF